MLVSLTSQDFDSQQNIINYQKLSNKVGAIIMFSKSTCPWCIRAKPEFVKLANHPGTQNILVGIVEDDAVPFVSRYPTFKMYNKQGRYQGDTGVYDRTMTGFMTALTKMLTDASGMSVTYTPRFEGMGQQHASVFDLNHLSPSLVTPRTRTDFFFRR